MGVDSAAVTSGVPSNTGHRPWLSILMPVYNVAPFVEECLGSILDQLDGQPGIEVILLDDQSTDGSADLCREMIARCQCDVRLLHHAENSGPSAARNSMLEVARGDYVWFVDADDKILPGAIRSLHEIVTRARPDIVMCDYVREGSERYPTFDGPGHRGGNSTEALVAGVFAKRRLHAWSRVWKRDLFGASIRFPVGAYFEDAATVPWLLLQAKSYYYAAEPWVYYRSRPGSIMARIAKTRSFDVRRNDDLAGALTGFSRALAEAVPDAAPETLAAVARFQSREFVKIAKRLVRGRKTSSTGLRAEIGRYRATMEAHSPVPFAAIARHYLVRGKIGRAAALGLALAMAKPQRS
ncbi:glycosyltransferase family 2 protein [Sphingopyxis fribergensis]